MKYEIILDPPVYDDLDEIPTRFRWRIINLIESLASEPYPAKSVQLREPYSRLYRIPLDKWRVIYEIDEIEKIVYIRYVKVKTGPETYEGLE